MNSPGRLRADTCGLQLPKSASEAEAYTFGRVNQAKPYAEAQLCSRTRCVSPITRDVLELCRDACNTYLIASSSDFKRYNTHASRTAIRNLEVALNERTWLRSVPEHDRETATDEVMTTRRLQMLARYGDCIAIICHELRIESAVAETAGYKLIGNKNGRTDIVSKRG